MFQMCIQPWKIMWMQPKLHYKDLYLSDFSQIVTFILEHWRVLQSISTNERHCWLYLKGYSVNTMIYDWNYEAFKGVTISNYGFWDDSQLWLFDSWRCNATLYTSMGHEMLNDHFLIFAQLIFLMMLIFETGSTRVFQSALKNRLKRQKGLICVLWRVCLKSLPYRRYKLSWCGDRFVMDTLYGIIKNARPEYWSQRNLEAG